MIGYLNGGTETDSAARRFTAAFRQGLGEQGYVEGRNVEILYRWADGRIRSLAGAGRGSGASSGRRDFCDWRHAAALAAKSATPTIPIVFATGADPVELGLVASLNRPGGNVTGVTFLGQELTAKRLELLHEIVPAAHVDRFSLQSDRVPSPRPKCREAEIAARILGVRLVILNASTPSEIEAAFAILAEQRIGALADGCRPLVLRVRADQLARIGGPPCACPRSTTTREIVEAGGLMSYGPSIPDAYRIAGNYVGRILKGEKPADLPVQQSTRIEMVLNLKTAKALGIEVPTATLLRATEVIE